MERKSAWRSNSPAHAAEPPCGGCGYQATCAAGLACDRFVYFVETGNAHGAHGARIPSRRLFARLFPEDALKALRRQWHKEGRELAAATMRGERLPMSKREHRRRWRAHQIIIWGLRPERREAYLAAHRAEAQRRSRLRGRLPMTPERASARATLAWARRRAQAAATGLTMSADEVRELRVRLGLTQKQLAAAIGHTRGAVEHWEVGSTRPLPADVTKLRAIAQGEVPTTSGVPVAGVGG